MKNQNNMSPPKINSPIVMTTNKNNMEEITKNLKKMIVTIGKQLKEDKNKERNETRKSIPAIKIGLGFLKEIIFVNK